MKVSREIRILIVASYNTGAFSSFILEQAKSLQKKVIKIDFFRVIGKGVKGYLSNYKALRKQLKNNNYDFIHAHYGLSGLLANLQRNVPVITTFHGSDTHFRKNRYFSLLCSRLSIYNILTNKKQISQLRLGGKRDNYSIIKCGIDTALFKPSDQSALRKKYGYSAEERLVLFASSFDRPVKNPELAKQAVKQLAGVKLIELKGFSRQEVADMMNIADVLLVTSRYETGPLVVKEALACNTPVVSTDVGDVKETIDSLPGCYITKPNVYEIVQSLDKAMQNKKFSNAYRGHVLENDLAHIANEIEVLYEKLKRLCG